MPKMILAITGIIASIFLVSCNIGPSRADSSTGEVGADETRAQPMNLPCFNCHSYERFRDPKVFPHENHREMGLHCTQCHIILAHTGGGLNKETCNNCHNLSLIRMSLTAMPAVFTHETHARRYDCNQCHGKLFRMKANSVKISMDSIFKGEFCGKCHNGKRAFASSECNRCHRHG